jgi:hypothetical protein
VWLRVAALWWPVAWELERMAVRLLVRRAARQRCACRLDVAPPQIREPQAPLAEWAPLAQGSQETLPETLPGCYEALLAARR